MRAARARLTVLAFAAIVVLGGGNGVAVRFSNRELAPWWGAALRFGLAAAILFAAVVVWRISLPRGRALAGSILYGLLGFAGAFGFIYWGLVRTPAGLGQIILALVPLLTLLFAVLQGLERFRWQNLIGGLVAITGVVVVFGQQLGAAVPAISMLAIVLAAACMAESNVVVKRFPKCHPIAQNAVAMGVGAVVLLGLSVVGGEPRVLPGQGQTWAAIAYVSVIGSVVVFSLFVYVIARWSASAMSYVMLLMPLVTVALAARLQGDVVTVPYIVGGALVLGGVYVGAFAPALPRRIPQLPLPERLDRAEPATSGSHSGDDTGPMPPTPATPGCA
jgi:drug/metabolite transporter (DMT)-like permease